ncbi:MAG: hypothetical protein IPM54_09380 [Polyangiaceae bacterium]|nr:hypothetical protein [Polyangiaceae bacterium]
MPFALGLSSEGTAAYQFGFKHGAMGRFRIPITPSSSISTGVGVTIQWIPWNDHRGPPGLDLWLPAEVGYEYRGEGFVLVGLGASYWLYAYRDYSGFSDSTFHQLFLENLPQLRPTARAGLGWAF